MSQYEQEDDLRPGGGEVDEETLKKGREDAEEEREGAESSDEPQPWAKLSSGEAD